MVFRLIERWAYILSESSFPGCFLFRSRGVFHFLPALTQSTVYDCVCWRVCLHTTVHAMRAPEGVDGGVHEIWDTGLLCCVLVWPSLCVRKHRLTPLRSDADKKRHEVSFPRNDVTACENPVTHQLLSVWIFLFLCLCFFCLRHLFHLSHLARLSPASLTSVERIQGLVYVVRTTPSLMKQIRLQCGGMFVLLVCVLLFWPLHTLLAACLLCWYYTD